MSDQDNVDVSIYQLAEHARIKPMSPAAQREVAAELLRVRQEVEHMTTALRRGYTLSAAARLRALAKSVGIE